MEGGEKEAEANNAARYLFKMGDEPTYRVKLYVPATLLMMVITIHRSLYGFDISVVDHDAAD